MKWTKYTIETTTEAEDFISAMLVELGVEGVEIENRIPLTEEEQAKMFIDFPPELSPDDGGSRVSFYLEEGTDHTTLLTAVRTELEKLRTSTEIGSGAITSSETEELDWINNWKQYFHSFAIGELLIKPTWEDLRPEDAGRPVIEIDPGISFGTGKHETTQLCIRALMKYIGGADAEAPKLACPKVLDVGCGSGILSIVALKLGARAVAGTDLDPDCMSSTRQNMQRNGLPESAGSFYVGNLIDDEALRENVGTGEYEIVVANILAEVLIPMAQVIPERLRPGGYFIASGIIDFKEQAVRDAIEAAGVTVTEITRQGEWVCLTSRRDV